MTPTLCWTCTAPGTGRCSWDRSKGEVPVEGWDAEPTTVLMQYKGLIPSYCVRSCPLYEPSGASRQAGRSGRPSVMSDEQLERWMARGYTDREIARRSGLSVHTVGHRRRKLNRQKREALDDA